MDEILTIHELAAYLKVNYQTIYRKVKKGEIPVFKVGKAFRFKKSDIERWVEAQKGNH